MGMGDSRHAPMRTCRPLVAHGQLVSEPSSERRRGQAAPGWRNCSRPAGHDCHRSVYQVDSTWSHIAPGGEQHRTCDSLHAPRAPERCEGRARSHRGATLCARSCEGRNRVCVYSAATIEGRPSITIIATRHRSFVLKHQPQVVAAPTPQLVRHAVVPPVVGCPTPLSPPARALAAQLPPLSMWVALPWVAFAA
jgi:hypothetical protein